jgi:hypothetical protein
MNGNILNGHTREKKGEDYKIGGFASKERGEQLMINDSLFGYPV